MRKSFTFILLLLVCYLKGLSQTNISAGNVSGTWTRTGSPYKVNGDVVVPNGQTLTIEPGVRIEFAQGKFMKVDGRILASGKSGSSDSIWFTKQNPGDTGSWRGVKFLSPSSSNDTSIFRNCVFSFSKGIYDTSWYKISGALTISAWGKVKINNCTFYKNEACVGSSVFLTRGAHCVINSCTFKYNFISIFSYKNGSSWSSIRAPRGSCVAVEYKSKAIVDSCVFKNNKRGKSYNYPFENITGSVIDVSGSYYYKVLAYMNIRNSVFDNNEGVMFYANIKSECNVQFCDFTNSPQGSSFAALYLDAGSKLYSSFNRISGNSINRLIFVDGGNLYSSNDLITNNRDFIAIIYSKDNDGAFPYAEFLRGRIFNNSYLSSSPTGIGVTVNKISNSLLANNKIDVMISAETILNNTIVNNYCDFSVLAIQRDANLRNNILWGNRSDSAKGRQIWIPIGVNSSFFNNLIQGDTSNFFLSNQYYGSKPTVYTSNISSDPKFKNPTLGYGTQYNASQADFKLVNTCQIYSPAINGGSLNVLGAGDFDLDGLQRVYDGTIDIGAYEDQSGPNQIDILKNLLNDTLCEKDNGVFRINARAKGLQYEWQSSANGINNWTKVSGSSNIDSLLINQVSLNSGGRYYRVLLNGTCDKDTSVNAQFIVNAKPRLNLGRDTAVCLGERITKTFSMPGLYLWQDGSSSKTYSQTINKDSIWTLTLKDSNACIALDTLRIVANPLPLVNLGADFNLHRLKSVNLDAGLQSSYLWDDGSTLRTRSFFGQDLGDGPHTLWVKVSNGFACYSMDTIKVNVINNSRLNPVEFSEIKLYPMPFRDELKIESEQDATIKIYTSDGKLIGVDQLDGKETHSIHTSSWNNGIYTIVILTSEGKDKHIKVQKLN